MKKSGLLMGVLCLLLIGLVTAQPPFSQTTRFNEGYIIEFPQQGTLPFGENYTFGFHVYNISNGVPIDNTTTSCYFHLYNNNGEHLIESEIPFMKENEWEILVLSGNFSEEAEYSYIVQCNSSILGGFNAIGFQVSNAQIEIPTSESIIYILLTLGVFLIFGLGLYFSIAIPYSNQTNEKGAVIKVTKAKYFKLFTIGLTYAFFVWLLNILIGVSNNFASLTLYYGFISFLFSIFIRLTIPIMILILVIMGAELIRDSNVTKTIKRFGQA